jgi:hypothetical protein
MISKKKWREYFIKEKVPASTIVACGLYKGNIASERNEASFSGVADQLGLIMESGNANH